MAGRPAGAGLWPPSRGPRRRRFHEDLDALPSARGGRAAIREQPEALEQPVQ